MTDALVVGAGPVGLALAIGLRQYGLDVRVVDGKPGPTLEPRAAVIWPRGVEALEDLGVAGEIERAANGLAVLHFHGGGRDLGAARLGTVESRYPRPLLIEQHVTERLLVARLAALGVSVEWGTHAHDLRQDADGVTVELCDAGGHSVDARAAWVVGCDGVRSRVRAAAGVAFPGGPTANLALWQVDAVPRWRHPASPTHGHYFLDRGACLGVFPVADGANRFFCYRSGESAPGDGPPSAVDMRDLIARVAGTPELQLDRVTWLSRTRFQTRRAARLRVGRVLLAGDAAHVWPSLGGHGMSLGLRGAHNLAWKLAAVLSGGSGEALLDTYEPEQRGAVAAFLRLMPYNLVERPSGHGGLLPRACLLRVGLRLPGVVARIERAASDLDAHHRTSALSSGSGAGGLRPGDRVPDVAVEADGQRIRLHTLLAYTRWTLLAPAALPAPALDRVRAALAPWGDRAQLSPIGGGTRAGIGEAGRGALVLVRPDRHVGLVVGTADVARLQAYLARWLGSGAVAPCSRREGVHPGAPDGPGLAVGRDAYPA